jgi:hypothetical protein
MDEQSAGHPVKGSVVNAHGTINGTAPAVGALSKYDVFKFFQFFVSIDTPGFDPPGYNPAGPVVMTFKYLTYLIGFINRCKGGITRITENIVTGFNTHPAMNTRCQ